MSTNSGGSSNGERGSKKSSATAAMEHFGSEVDIKIRSATGNPKVEQYFGSEVDLGLRTSDNPNGDER